MNIFEIKFISTKYGTKILVIIMEVWWTKKY